MTDNNQWKVATSKKKKQKMENIPVKHYWNGFDENGNEKWYIELNNGVVYPKNTIEYRSLVKKYFRK